MTHFAVSLGLADGRCAVTGYPTPVPIVVEVEGDLLFPEGHIAANRLAAEIAGRDVNDPEIHSVTTQPFVWKLDLLTGQATA